MDKKVCTTCGKEFDEDKGHCHTTTGDCHCNECHDVSVSKGDDNVCEFC